MGPGCAAPGVPRRNALPDARRPARSIPRGDRAQRALAAQKATRGEGHRGGTCERRFAHGCANDSDEDAQRELFVSVVRRAALKRPCSGTVQAKGQRMPAPSSSRPRRLLLAAAVLVATVFGTVMTSLPRAAFLAHTAPDDAYYYLEIARRAGESGWPTFDGDHTTTGFHPPLCRPRRRSAALPRKVAPESRSPPLSGTPWPGNRRPPTPRRRRPGTGPPGGRPQGTRPRRRRAAGATSSRSPRSPSGGPWR
jgi:hypothetical protein